MKLDLTDRRFGSLVALSRTAAPGRGHAAYWLCRCDCGNTATIDQHRLGNGRTTSCGCTRKETIRAKRTRHGHRYTGTYKSWASMKQRCTNPNNPDWRYYGGRGIKMDPRWERFETFLAEMGEAGAGLTIDRIDVDGNYELGNCRWATRAEQRLNQRPREASPCA